MKCSKCQHDNGEQNKFCEACGAKLRTKCSACGAENRPAVKFCESCGHSMSAGRQAPAHGYQPETTLLAGDESTVSVRQAPSAKKSTATIEEERHQETSKWTDQQVVERSHATASPGLEAVATKSIEQPVITKKKSRTGLAVIVSGILLLGSGAYLAYSPVSPQKKVASPASQVSTDATTAPEKSVPPEVSKASSVQVENPLTVPAMSASQPPPIESELESASKLAIPHLKGMLNAVLTSNDSTIQQEVDAIKQLALPSKGNRKAARAANSEGLAALKADTLDVAVAKFKEGVASDYSDQELINNLGHAYLLQGKNAEAIGTLHQALTLAPTRSSAWANLALASGRQGKFDDAVAAYLLAFRFSQNQQKSRALIAEHSQNEQEKIARDAATSALAMIGANK